MHLGVTGRMLSGKSEFSTRLARAWGADCFNADAFVDDLYRDPEIRNIMVDSFGNGLYKGDDFQKSVLSKRVFQSVRQLKKLESIIHPYVEAEIVKRCRAGTKNTVCEIPLLFETGMDHFMDLCVLVVCRDDVRRQRAPLRGLSMEEVERREQFQWTDSQRRSRDPYVVENNESLEVLDLEIDRLLNTIREGL